MAKKIQGAAHGEAHAVNFGAAEAAVADVLYAEGFGYSHEACQALATRIMTAIEALPAHSAEPHDPGPL